MPERINAVLSPDCPRIPIDDTVGVRTVDVVGLMTPIYQTQPVEYRISEFAGRYLCQMNINPRPSQANGASTRTRVLTVCEVKNELTLFHLLADPSIWRFKGARG